MKSIVLFVALAAGTECCAEGPLSAAPPSGPKLSAYAGARADSYGPGNERDRDTDIGDLFLLAFCFDISMLYLIN